MGCVLVDGVGGLCGGGCANSLALPHCARDLLKLRTHRSAFVDVDARR